MTDETSPRPEPVSTGSSAGAAQPQQEWVAEVFRDLAGPTAATDPAEATDSDEQALPDPQPPTGDPTPSAGPAPTRPRSREGRITLDGLPVGGPRRDGRSWARRVLTGVRSALRSSRLDADLVASIAAVQRPVTTGRRVAVGGVRGGAGSTTVAALLAAVLADRRADGVLAVDTDAPLHSLLWRFGIDDPTATDDDPAAAFAPERARGLWLVPGRREDLTRGLGEYARFFGATIVDLGSAYARATEVGAQATVLVAPATLDGLRAVRAVAIELAEDPSRVEPRPVVALVQQTPGSDGIDLAQALILLNRYSLAAVTLPYDRHLAAGGPIEPELISEATVAAATALAARVLDVAQPAMTTPGSPS